LVPRPPVEGKWVDGEEEEEEEEKGRRGGECCE